MLVGVGVSVKLIRGFKLNSLWTFVVVASVFVAHIAPTTAVEDADLKFIKKAISLTPVQRFTTYPIVVQEVIDEITNYRHYLAPGKTGSIIFQRKESDLHKAAVILNENEDHLTYTKEGEDNRIYVVLVQNPTEEKYYHVVYAYARNVPPDDVMDSSVIVINREKRRIEWDVWDLRGGAKNKAGSFGWTTCLESLFVPCKPFFADVDEFPDYGEKSGSSKFSGAKKIKPAAHVDKRIEFKTESGLDAGMNFDFFGDLDDTNEQALMVGSVVDAITDTVQFFAETNKRFSNLENMNTSQTTLKAVETFMSNDYVKLLLLDLKNIGNHSFRSTDGKKRDLNKLIAEGYRVLRGLLNNTESDKMPERLMIGVFADVKSSPSKKRTGGHRGKTKATLVAGGTGSSSKSKAAAKFKWKGSTGIEDIINTISEVHRKRRQYPGSVQYGAAYGAPGVKNYGQMPGYTGVVHQQKVAPTIPGKTGGLINGQDWRIFCARKDLSAGEKGWCGCHVGKEFSWGTSEGLGDAVSSAFSGKKISNDPSMFDPVFNTGVSTFWCGGGAAVFDIAGEIAKPFGLNPLVAAASTMTGTIAGMSGGGPFLVGHLIHQGVKAVGQSTGTGGIIGMKGAPAGRGIGMPSGPSKQEVLPSVETDAEIFGHLGWRTQDVDDLQDLAVDKFTKIFSSKPFIGLGNCPYSKVTAGDFSRATTVLEVSKLYHKILLTHCLDKQVALLEDLVDEGHLHLNDDKTLSISHHCPSIKDTVLSERQIDRLSLAFSFAVFSQVYSEEYGNATKNPVHAGLKISRPVHVMAQFAINFLKESRRVAPIHFIKLSRDLAQTIKTTFVKSLQDFYRYKDCLKCKTHEKQEATNDVLTLLGIFQFIIEGLGPVEHNGIGISAALTKFVKLNEYTLKKKLDFYTQHN